MNIISVRVNDDEMAILEKASKLYSNKISSMIKQIVFEKLEEDYDIKAVMEYEKQKEAGTLETRDIEEVAIDMNIDWKNL